MNSLRRVGGDEFSKKFTFDDGKKDEIPVNIPVIRAWNDSTTTEFVSVGNLAATTYHQEKVKTEPASLLLVRLDRRGHRKLPIPKGTFLSLVAKFHIDKMALYRLAREATGFFEFNSTYYIGTPTAITIWSYQALTQQSQGFFFPLIIQERDHAIFDSYYTHISSPEHGGYVHDPWFLRYIAILATIDFVENAYEEAFSQIQTNGQDLIPNDRAQKMQAGCQVHDYPDVLGNLGALGAILAVAICHIPIARKMVDMGSLNDVPEDIQQALKILRNVLDSRREDFRCLEQRLGSLLQALSNIANHNVTASDMGYSDSGGYGSGVGLASGPALRSNLITYNAAPQTMGYSGLARGPAPAYHLAGDPAMRFPDPSWYSNGVPELVYDPVGGHLVRGGRGGLSR